MRAILAALCCALVTGSALAAATTSRACLTSETRAVLEQAEAAFGATFDLVSTCRPGATIAGTDQASQHAFGRAVDLRVPRGIKKRALVRWLYAHARGVVMTYSNMPHVHFDMGPYHKLALGRDAYGGRHAFRRLARHAAAN